MIFFREAAGISLNWSGGISTPNIADMRGTRNVFLFIGIGSGRINPSSI